MILETIQFILLAVVPAIVFHELAHGLVAWWMGDSTAKQAGRLTLNPIKHIDPIGSLLVPGFLYLIHSPFYFGWAKPVPVNFMNIKNYRLGLILVALAGPISNVILACGYILILKYGILSQLVTTWQWAIIFNIILCVFNLVPIPPLDGSRIVMGFLPRQMMYYYSRLEPIGMIIVFILLQFGLFRFLHPFINWLASLLGKLL